MTESIRLTQYSHGAGCGCKISPQVLDTLLKSSLTPPHDSNLLVGNDSRDDAAVYDLGDGTAAISTTDFFMPIVDDPFEFGRIAAANAISDIYAMGGTPLMAIAILGWPVNSLPPQVAQRVIEGGRSICHEAGMHLAGGHSIDSPEPIFGLAVTGRVTISEMKQNNTAQPGDILFLSKPLGVGILTTAEKQAVLQPQHSRLAAENMMKLNTVGASLAKIDGVSAMTDVTGFGLLGHLSEVCTGSNVKAQLDLAKIPLLDQAVNDYRDMGCVPGGCNRNWQSIEQHIGPCDQGVRDLLCDPQTSGGLLIAVAPEQAGQVEQILAGADCHTQSIGVLTDNDNNSAPIEITP